MTPAKAVAWAVLAAGLGLTLGVLTTGPGLLLRTGFGQWLFQNVAPGQPAGASEALALGQPVAAFSLAELNGGRQTLPVPGRWQLINYWASWCGPCRAEMPWLDAAQRASAGRYDIIGVAMDNAYDARQFLRESPVGYRQLQENPGTDDSSNRLGNRWGVLPFTVLIDPRGRLVKRHIGAFKDAEAVRAWIDGEVP